MIEALVELGRKTTTITRLLNFGSYLTIVTPERTDEYECSSLELDLTALLRILDPSLSLCLSVDLNLPIVHFARVHAGIYINYITPGFAQRT